MAAAVREAGLRLFRAHQEPDAHSDDLVAGRDGRARLHEVVGVLVIVEVGAELDLQVFDPRDDLQVGDGGRAARELLVRYHSNASRTSDRAASANLTLRLVIQTGQQLVSNVLPWDQLNLSPVDRLDAAPDLLAPCQFDLVLVRLWFKALEQGGSHLSPLVLPEVKSAAQDRFCGLCHGLIVPPDA